MSKKNEDSKKVSKTKKTGSLKASKTSPKKVADKETKSAESTKSEKGKPCSIKINKSSASKFTMPLLLILVLVLILMGSDFFVQYLNNSGSIAVVDGHRVSRSEYIERLEEMHGDQVANMLIEEKVIELMGEEEEVTVVEEDVDEQYEQVEEQAGGAEALQQTLMMYGMEEQELRDQLANELILREIVAPTLEYTEEDLHNFFEQNKEMIYPQTDDVNFEDEKDSVEEMYLQDQVHQQRGQLIQEFKDDVSIQLNTPQAMEQEDRRYELFGATRNVINNLLGREVEEEEDPMQDPMMMDSFEGMDEDVDIEMEIEEDEE